MPAESVTTESWPVPPADGYRFDDVLTMPGLPNHTELLDGGFVIVSPQSSYHSVLVGQLEQQLRATCPPELRVRREILVRFSDRTALEPDISIVPAGAVTSRDQSYFDSAQVLMAVEVVSPTSMTRDRVMKPHVYAAAGITHFWRVEWDSEKPTILTYRLGPHGQYEQMGEHLGRLQLSEPYAINLDLTNADRI